MCRNGVREVRDVREVRGVREVQLVHAGDEAPLDCGAISFVSGVAREDLFLEKRAHD